MSTDEFKDNWLRYLEAWNQRDYELTDRLSEEYVPADITYHFPGSFDFGELINLGQKEFVRAITSQNPDFHISVNDALVDGDKMILRGTMLLNHATTGAVESVVFMEISRVAEGKMIEGWGVFVPGKW